MAVVLFFLCLRATNDDDDDLSTPVIRWYRCNNWVGFGNFRLDCRAREWADCDQFPSENSVYIAVRRRMFIRAFRYNWVNWKTPQFSELECGKQESIACRWSDVGMLQMRSYDASWEAPEIGEWIIIVARRVCGGGVVLSFTNQQHLYKCASQEIIGVFPLHASPFSETCLLPFSRSVLGREVTQRCSEALHVSAS